MPRTMNRPGLRVTRQGHPALGRAGRPRDHRVLIEGTTTTHRAWLLLSGVIVVWGLHWTVTKMGLESIPPMTYAMLRVLVGAIVLALLMRRRRRLALPDRRDLPVILSY